MPRKLLISIPEYWENVHSSTVLPPQNFADMCERVVRKAGLWNVKTIDKYTGEVLIENWLSNIWTDNGAVAALRGGVGAAITTITPANIMVVDTSLPYTTVQASIPASVTTSITIGTLTAALSNGQNLILGTGAANPTTIVVNNSGGYAAGYSGAITIVSITPNRIYNVGENIKAVVSSVDPGTLSGTTAYTSALPTGNIVFASTTGSGNRSVTITNSPSNLFSTTANSNPATAAVASYTGAWMVNTNPVSTTAQTFVRIAFDAPVAVSASSNGQVTIVEKI